MTLPHAAYRILLGDRCPDHIFEVVEQETYLARRPWVDLGTSRGFQWDVEHRWISFECRGQNHDRARQLLSSHSHMAVLWSVGRLLGGRVYPYGELLELGLDDISVLVKVSVSEPVELETA